MPLLTTGHGRADRAELGGRLTGAGVQLLVDVRRFPGSRNHPDVATEALAGWLPELGIGYRWDERLGGRRRLPPGEPVVDDRWTVAQFAAGLAEVLAAAATETVAVMCSESVWWRCHRRLIADVAVLARGVPVTHLMPGGRLTPHQPSAGAVLQDGVVSWPAA